MRKKEKARGTNWHDVTCQRCKREYPLKGDYVTTFMVKNNPNLYVLVQQEGSYDPNPSIVVD